MEPDPANQPTAPIDAASAARLGVPPVRDEATASEWPPEVMVAMAEPARRFGRYILVERAGAGGMGEVHRAWQRDLRRWVALKFLRADVAEVARFLQEARTAAGLDHPAVAKIYDAGCEQGKHFIAMQWVDGGPLRHGVLAERAAAALIVEAAGALQHAHERGVIHRDVKPANLMVTAAGRPVLVDFGLARRCEGPHVTATGVAVGTPGFMAPEQLAGPADQVGPRADVYGLGATLYYVLTGHAPNAGATVPEVLARLGSEDAIPPRKWNPALDRDLETVVLRSLERDAARRYPSAAALGEDLARWLRGEPISARPIGWGERLARRARRNPAFAALVGVVGLALAGALLALVTLADVGRSAAGVEAAARAEREFLLGRLAEAERAADEAIRIRPEAAAGHYWRARVLLTRAWSARELPPARVDQELVELAPRYPGSPAAVAQRAQAERAFADVLAAADATPEQRDTAAGLLAFARGDAAGAARRLDAAWAAGGVLPDVGLLRVEARYGAHDFRGALAALDELSARHERGPSRLLWESRVLHALGVEASLAGADPLPWLERATKAADAALAAGAPAPRARALRAQALVARAEHEHDRGADPEPTWAEAEAGLAGAGDGDVEVLLVRAGIRLARAEARARNGAVDPARPVEYARAIEAFDAAVAAAPGYAGAHLFRAHATFALSIFLQKYGRGRPDELRAALADTERALALDAGAVSAALLRARVLGQVRRAEAPPGTPERARLWDEEVAEFTRLAAASPEPARAHLYAAIALYDRVVGDGLEGREAIALLEPSVAACGRALASHPGYARALFHRSAARAWIGREAARLGDDPLPAYRAAIEDATAGLAVRPASAEGHQRRATLHLDVATARRNAGGDPGEAFAAARADLDRAAVLDPRSPLVDATQAGLSHAIALHRAAQGEDADEAFARALEEWTRALARRADDAFLLLQRGNTRLVRVLRRRAPDPADRAELERALADLDQALAGGAPRGDGLDRRARARRELAARDEGPTAARMALLQGASEDVEELLRLRPRDPEAWRLRAEVHETAGRADEARRDRAKAAELEAAAPERGR